MDRISYRGEEMPGVPGILFPAHRLGDLLSERRNDDVPRLEFRISPDFRGELSVLDRGYGLTFGLQI